MTDREHMSDEFIRRLVQWDEQTQEREQARERRPTGEGRVYFIREANGAIKIGFTDVSVDDRLASLQSGNPRPLRVVGETPGGRDEERAWHRRFAHLRIGGEWFKPARELLTAIEEASEGRRDSTLLTEGEVADFLSVGRSEAVDVMDRIGCVRVDSRRRLERARLVAWIDAGGDGGP